ncbi:MAG: alanine--tRNA ligase-related protein, partial [Nitrosospira sp.]
RRAIRHGYKLGQNQPFFYLLVDDLAKAMGQAYPELVEAKVRIVSVLKQEEERFLITIDSGMRILNYATSEENFALHWLSDKTGLRLKYVDLVGINYAFDGGLIDDAGEEIPVEVVLGEEDNVSYERIYKAIYAFKNDPFLYDQIYVVFVGSEIPLRFKSLLAGCDFRHKEFLVRKIELEPFRRLSGDLVFKLHDTYGFPLDLTQDVCREHSVSVDVEGFETAMAHQKQQARAASRFADIQDGIKYSERPTQFYGYESLQHEGQILAIYKEGSHVDFIEAGDEAVIVLDQTPFYAESGGQVGDCGELLAANGTFAVSDTQKIHSDVFGHTGLLRSGRLVSGDKVVAKVNPIARARTERNHSVTHLMHKALGQVLGAHVQQKGSLVDADKTRFDFAHNQPVTDEEIRKVEVLVNAEILTNAATGARMMTIEDAKKTGAMMLFGEKYGDEVRVLDIGSSRELCGGTHVKRTGDIGLFKIVSESGVAAGVRRVEATTGEGALAYIQQQESQLQQVA